MIKMLSKTLRGICGAIAFSCLVGAGMIVSPGLAQATTLVQEFFVPLPEDQVRKSLYSLYSGTGNNIESVLSLVITNDTTVIHYDHWEDGYEIDLENPTQL